MIGNSHYALLSVVIATLMVENCGAATAEVVVDSKTYHSATLTLSASTGDIQAATAVLTGAATGTPDPVFPTGTDTPSVEVKTYGLTSATKYTLDFGTVQVGGSNIGDGTAQKIFCTDPAPVTGLQMLKDSSDSAIKIEWSEITGATYKVSLDSTEVEASVPVGTTTFTFDSTTLEGKGITLEANSDHTCKVEAVVTIVDCEGGQVMSSAEIDCFTMAACKDSSADMVPAKLVLSLMAMLTFSVGYTY